MACFYHCSSTDDDPKHDMCPGGESSWCFFQGAKAKKEQPMPHSKMKINFTLRPKEKDKTKGF